MHDDDGDPLELYHKRQQDRLAAVEARSRREVALEEQAARHGPLANAVASLEFVLEQSFVLEDERHARRDLSTSLARDAAALASVFPQVALKYQLLPGERAGRQHRLDVEALDRSHLFRRLEAQRLLAVLPDIEREEQRWRVQISQREAAEFADTLADVAAEQLVFVQSGRHPSSEPRRRYDLWLAEARQRAGLASWFCRLNLTWLEQWRRQTIQLSVRLLFQAWREAGDISRREALEREAMRLEFEPLQLDLLEELAFQAKRRARRDAKLAALRALRHAELTRLGERHLESRKDVDWWKADELDRIAEEHARIIADVADAATQVANDVGGRPNTVVEDTARQLETAYAALHRPTTSFSDIQAYRRRLAGFDAYVSTVERALDTPEMLQTRRTVTSDASPGGPPRETDASGFSSPAHRSAGAAATARVLRCHREAAASPPAPPSPQRGKTAPDRREDPFDLSGYSTAPYATAAADDGSAEAVRFRPAVAPQPDDAMTATMEESEAALSALYTQVMAFVRDS